MVVCLQLWVSGCVDECTCVCTCMWTPLVDTGCLACLHSTLVLETWSLTKSGDHRFVKTNWSVSSKDSFYFHFPSAGIQGCHHIWLSMWLLGNPNLGLYTWRADSLPSKPPPQHPPPEEFQTLFTHAFYFRWARYISIQASFKAEVVHSVCEYT